jgi:hypothetical protein
MDIKRYRTIAQPEWAMEENTQGEYVRYEDIKHLLPEREIVGGKGTTITATEILQHMGRKKEGFLHPGGTAIIEERVRNLEEFVGELLDTSVHGPGSEMRAKRFRARLQTILDKG